MKALPNYRAAHLKPYLSFFHSIGAPVESGLSLFRLPMTMDYADDFYLPQFPTLAFLAYMEKTQGIDELPLLALDNLKITDLNAHFISKAYQSPTLLAALMHFSRLLPLDDPFTHFCMADDETAVKLCMSYRVSLDPHSMIYEDWNELLVLISFVRAFAGDNWQPEEMAFRSYLPLGQYALEQFPDTRVLIAQNTNWITVPRHLLSRPPCFKTEHMAVKSAHFDYFETDNTVEPDLVTSLSHILPSYMAAGYPSIELAAQLVGISVRSLQRNLCEAQTSYSEIIKKTWFKVAARLLRDTDKKTTEVAFELGYDDPSHFSRAFKRVAGISPREYRYQQG